MKRFGQYIKDQRLRLGLNQEEVPGFGQSYISDIELGRKIPAKRDTIEKLAKVLHLDTSKKAVDRLWALALFDDDPYEYFKPDNGDGGRVLSNVNEHPSRYGAYESAELEVGMPGARVLSLLGKPDRLVRFGEKEKWMYESLGVHVIFEDGKVVDAIFK